MPPNPVLLLQLVTPKTGYLAGAEVARLAQHIERADRFGSSDRGVIIEQIGRALPSIGHDLARGTETFGIDVRSLIE